MELRLLEEILKATGITKDKEDEPSPVGSNTCTGPPAQPRAGTKCNLVYLRQDFKSLPMEVSPQIPIFNNTTGIQRSTSHFKLTNANHIKEDFFPVLQLHMGMEE